MVALRVVGPWSLESQVFISVWPWPRGLSHSSLLRLPPPLEVGSFFAREVREFLVNVALLVKDTTPGSQERSSDATGMTLNFARKERIFGECSFIGQRHYSPASKGWSHCVASPTEAQGLL